MQLPACAGETLDLADGTLTFREKGGKTITNLSRVSSRSFLGCAIEAGAIGRGPDAYIIPMIRDQRRSGDRDPRIIWRTVKQLARRAGIEATPHAVRAAFAVHFLEGHPGEIEALQRLMGHSKIGTTEIYLRRLDRTRAMERVKDLSWGLRFEALDVEAPTRIELVYGEKDDGEPHRPEPAPAGASELPAELQRVVERFASPSTRDWHSGPSRSWREMPDAPPTPRALLWLGAYSDPRSGAELRVEAAISRVAD